MTSELYPALRPRTVTVASDGLSLACLVWGDERDPALVAIHGNGGHARWWDPLLPWLVPGWRVVAPHLRGHGESDWAEPPRYALADFARDLDAVMGELAPGPVPVVGHSKGGRVALAVAAARPERVAALAVLDSRFDPIDPRFAAKYRASVAGKREGRKYATRADAMAAFRFVPDEPGVDPRRGFSSLTARFRFRATTRAGLPCSSRIAASTEVQEPNRRTNGAISAC